LIAAALHDGEGGSVDHSRRLRGQRQMQREHIDGRRCAALIPYARNARTHTATSKSRRSPPRDDFLPSQIVAAIGLAFGITALIVFGVANITPADAPTIAAMIQIGRLFGNEVGTAFIQTFVRVREQVYSNLTGLHFTATAQSADSAAKRLVGDPESGAINADAEMIWPSPATAAFNDFKL
jgi:hypothetical protein